MGKFKTYAKKGQQLMFLRKDSHALATKQALEKLLAGRPIDFLFIDGDHRYTGIKRDWKLYSPLVKENGIVALHDILFHPKALRCKVDKLWKEIKGEYRHCEFITNEDPRGWGQWGGIGAIYYKAR
jgi:predicted O-methyltransferase YrrM